MILYFDMDGTIANLYAVENWLPMLRAEDPTPYANARPMVNMSYLARLLNQARRKGYRIAVLSWLSKESSPEYDAAVTSAKLTWLKKHLPSVEWDEIFIVPYDTPKWEYGAHSNVLFDDEAHNREDWETFGGGIAFDASEMLTVLKDLVRSAK